MPCPFHNQSIDVKNYDFSLHNICNYNAMGGLWGMFPVNHQNLPQTIASSGEPRGQDTPSVTRHTGLPWNGGSNREHGADKTMGKELCGRAPREVVWTRGREPVMRTRCGTRRKAAVPIVATFSWKSVCQPHPHTLITYPCNCASC